MGHNGMSKFLSVEIGGTKQQLAVGGGDGRILEIKSIKLGDKTRADSILNWFRENIRDVMDRERIKGIGVGFGGPLELKTGRVLCSLQVPGWQDFSLKEWFEKEFMVPAVIVNDTVLGGLGELVLGSGVGSKRFFYTNIGTGIGGVLYIDCRPYDGSGYGAGYMGNTWVPDWTHKTPGARTRLELICSGNSIEKRLNMPGYVPESSVLGRREGRISCSNLAAGVKGGDYFCMEELDRIAQSFSIGLTNILAIAAPDRIVVGGGVAKMGAPLFNRIRKYTEEYSFAANTGRYEIVESHLMDRGVLVGGLLAAGEPGLAEWYA